MVLVKSLVQVMWWQIYDFFIQKFCISLSPSFILFIFRLSQNISIYLHTFINIFISIYLYPISISIHLYIHVYVCIYMYMYIYNIHIYIHIYVYIYIYIYIHVYIYIYNICIRSICGQHLFRSLRAHQHSSDQMNIYIYK